MTDYDYAFAVGAISAYASVVAYFIVLWVLS
jgi:hypothetical protein